MCNTLYQSTITAAKEGFASSVAVLARAAFEAALALFFVVRRDIVLREVGQDPSRGISGMSPHVRACLYFGHVLMLDIASREKYLDTHPELAATLDENKRLLIQYKSEAGAWQRLVGMSSYCGKSTRAIALSLGYDEGWYETIYSDQSQAVHAKSMIKFLEDIDDEQTITLTRESSSATIEHQLGPPIAIMLQCVQAMHERFDYPTELSDRVLQWEKAYTQIISEQSEG